MLHGFISHLPLADIVRLSRPCRACLSRADSGYLEATPAVYVCVCVRYQETATLNRGNSTGLLQADFKRGDADS